MGWDWEYSNVGVWFYYDDDFTHNFYISAKIYQHCEGDQSKGYWNQDT